ncbi:MAG: glycerate kinase [Actinobacteria bacterium]|nr:glycerate kinase [Actinomycetota bacterium]
MHLVVAPDKFKGSLTAREVADHISAGLAREAPDVPVKRVPVADGGDGTLDAALAAGFARVAVRAHGPTGTPVDTAFAVRDGVAVIEMAGVSGLRLLPPGGLDALRSSSFGLGEVIRAALDQGCHTVVLGIGGSASTDGGAGMLTALGARLIDAAGDDLPPGGGALSALERVDLSGLHPRLSAIRMVVASDVDNPLLGPHGAAAVYGPQKGATHDDVALLDVALTRWDEILGAALRATPAGGSWDGMMRDRPGAGAAGGVGYAAMAVLGGVLEPGIRLILDLVRFADHLPGAALVITGEGSLDEQTLSGKAPAGVAAAAGAAGVPVVAVAGRLTLSRDELHAAGFARAYALTDIEPDLLRCVTRAGPLLETVARQIARDWLRGHDRGRPPDQGESLVHRPSAPSTDAGT